MLRRISVILILLTAVFFAVGWWPVQKGWLELNTYLALAGIVGGIASVVGLLGLVRSPLSRRDFDHVELESLAKIAQTERELKELEGKKASAHSELEHLTKTRAELADLVRKASSVLFLREELDRSSQRLVKFLGDHPELRRDLVEYRENVRRLTVLQEELKAHPDAELINQVMIRVRNRAVVRKSELIDAFSEIPLVGPFFKAVMLLFDAYERAFRIALGRRKP